MFQFPKAHFTWPVVFPGACPDPHIILSTSWPHCEGFEQCGMQSQGPYHIVEETRQIQINHEVQQAVGI